VENILTGPWLFSASHSHRTVRIFSIGMCHAHKESAGGGSLNKFSC